MKILPEIDNLELIWKLNYEWMILLVESFKNSQNEKGKIIELQSAILTLNNIKQKSDNLKERIQREVSGIEENKWSNTYLKSVMKFINSTEIDFYSKRMVKTKPYDFFDKIDLNNLISEESLKTNMDLVIDKLENNWIGFNQSNSSLIYKIHINGYHKL